MIEIETKQGFDYMVGLPSTLYRWHCTRCSKSGVWLLVKERVEKNGQAHADSHEPVAA